MSSVALPKQGRVALRYYLRPLPLACIIPAACLYAYFALVQADPIRSEIVNSLSGTATTFSLTFIAFSVTALALIQLLQSKDWFEAVAKSIYFQSFMSRFLLSIKFCIVLLAFSIVSAFLVRLQWRFFPPAVLCMELFSLFYIIMWSWDCINDFINLFRK